MKKIILIGLVGVVGLAGCQQRPADAVLLEEQPAIFPDYNGVTVPAGIAPLNFNVVDEGVDLVDVTVAGSKGGEVHAQGDYADFSEDDWHTLTEQNRGGELTVTVCGRKDGKWIQYKDFKIYVSPYALEEWAGYGAVHELPHVQPYGSQQFCVPCARQSWCDDDSEERETGVAEG